MTDSYYSINSMCHLNSMYLLKYASDSLLAFGGNSTQTGLDLGVTDRHRERCIRERESRERESERERERERVELLREIERQRDRDRDRE